MFAKTLDALWSIGHSRITQRLVTVFAVYGPGVAVTGPRCARAADE